jgi:sec-independent protein translocase protein TatA
MFGLGLGEILIISIFALIFIGPKKLPELARSLGKGIREFQSASRDLKEHINHNTEANDPKVSTESTENTKTTS